MAEKTSREKTIAATYAELQRCDQNGNFERALKAANRILHMEPQEQLAFHCKIVCLVQLGKFEDAMQHMKKNANLSGNLHFEKAYCLYRLNQHSEALKIIDSLDDVGYHLKELKAQILYRIENYTECVQVYRDIIKNTNDEYEDERQTNLSAALVFLDKTEINKEVNSLREDTYELCYNKACLLVQSGQYSEAEKKLKQCEKLCREALEEEEASEDDIDVDLALIRVQLGFVYHKQGRVKEAHQLYSTALKIKLEDPALVAVASNNVVAINKDQNIFDSKKKIKSASNEQLTHKLPSSIRKYIGLNTAIFAMYTNQTEQCTKLCKSVQENWPELSVYTNALAAYNLLKASKLSEAVDLLKKAEANNNWEALFYKLCCAQLYLTQGERLQACQVLENLGDDSYRPGVVGALITLYLNSGKEDVALKVFERTVDWYKKHNVKKGDLSEMWRQAAEFHIRNGHPQVAANSLEELLRVNPKDKKTVAQLILAYAKFDPARVLELRKQLPEIKALSAGVDLENVENPSWINVRKSTPSKQDAEKGNTPRSEGPQKKKHKKRKGKLPKYYDPLLPPDPERWLPKYERAGYRKKRDRRMKEVMKGSQGTASGQAEQFDFSGKLGEEAQEAMPDTPKTKTPQQQQQKKVNQKKKNKRR